MGKRMTIWGVGPKFIVFSVLCLVLALVAHYVWYPLFVIPGVPYVVLGVIGLILISIGIPIWVTASREVDRAFEAGELATQGVYALCRHPIYGSATFFVVPGILLFFRSWVLFAVPVAMYILARLLVRREDAYLRAKFGQAYLEYSANVGAIFPRIWRLYHTMWYPVDTGQVTEHVYAVRVRDVNMFIYADGEHTVAIDAAYAGDVLFEELKRLPISSESVTHLFLTHADVDHAGGLGAFPGAQVYLARDEEQMIDGTTARLFGFYHSPRLARAYSLLEDGDVVTVGTIRVRAVATPGHTFGAMSFVVNDRVLFSGDTLVLRNGWVYTFYRLFNKDPVTQRESIRKLASLQDIDLLCTAHTGYTGDYVRAMRYWREETQLRDRIGKQGVRE
jgi:glyoxylase-like metal-dependent hydrolase (beta-lactamase superfamily II)/protein-S-isoprenylcysteine O-methyltransferase Ste14